MLYKRNKIKLNFINLILIVIITFTLLICNFTTAYTKERKIIKVGYPIVKGFTDIKNGSYTGYSFDYLFELSKYTGWELEFIEMSLSDALDKLDSGEIDIVSGMIKNEKTSEIFEFPEQNYGYTYSILATLKSNTNISKSNYNTLNGIRVGYLENNEYKLNKLNEFFKLNNISDIKYIPYTYKDDNTLIDALNNNEVDAIVTGDLLIEDNLKILSKFDSLPYYFATTKGKTEIIRELNSAIVKLNESDPNFALNLYHKYFENQIDSSIIFTEEELNYLNSIPSLKAIYIDNFEPLQYYNEDIDEPSGFYIDIFKLISEKLNLELEYIKTNNYEEAYNLINKDKYNLLIGVPSNYRLSEEHDILFTKSFANISLLKVYSKKSKSNISNTNNILALPEGFNGYLELSDEYEIKYYPTLKDCLIAVEKDEAFFTYGNSYTISSYITNNYFSNLVVISNSDSIPISLTLSNESDEILFNILNKVISSFDDTTIENLMYSNITNIKHNISIKDLFLSNLSLCISIILIVVLIIAFLIGISIKLKFNNLKKTKELLILKSQSDPLTEIYNRSTAKELINNYFEFFNNQYYCFIILDIDYFKQINDTFGHKIGDKVLIEFSNLLKQFFNSDNILLSRLGGDEFIVFIKDLKKDNYLEFIKQNLSDLCKLMNKEFTFDENTQKISISIGAYINNKKSSFNKLYERSDELLYKVKDNGRNNFEIHDNIKR